MITFKLWRGLRFTSVIHAHPIFKQTLRLRHRPENAILRWDALGIPKWVRQIVRYLFLALLTLLFVFLIYLMVFLVFLYVILSLLFSGAFWGLHWAMGIAGMIARGRERGTQDLLALTPPGPGSVAWMIACAYIHADQAFRSRTRRFRVLLWALVIATAGTIFLSLILDQTPSPYALNFLSAGIGVILTGLALHFELMASLVSAVLVGMLAPTVASRQVEASLVAMAMFTGIQIGYLFLAYVMLFIALPQLSHQFALEGFSLLAVYGLFLACLIGIREGVTRLLMIMTRRRVGEIDESLLGVAPV